MMTVPLKCLLLAAMVVSCCSQVVLAQIQQQEVDLLVGKSMVIDADKRVEQVVVVNPKVADAEVISPTQVVLIGRQLGATDVIMHYEDGTAAVHAVEVMVDEHQLQSRLDNLFGSGLFVDSSHGVLVLRGDVDNVEEAVQIEAFMESTGLTYLDMTRVPGIQQVLLKVKIAEVSRSGLRELGFGASINGSSFKFAGSTNGGISGPYATAPAIPDSANLFAGIPGADLDLFINALTVNNYVRLLAEPNLVAISGEEATFLVGGEFPVPVVQGTSVGVGSSTTIEYKEVGVRLNFRPEVLGENRIRL
jgi:pilus assembly protein CpaC